MRNMRTNRGHAAKHRGKKKQLNAAEKKKEKENMKRADGQREKKENAENSGRVALSGVALGGFVEGMFFDRGALGENDAVDLPQL